MRTCAACQREYSRRGPVILCRECDHVYERYPHSELSAELTARLAPHPALCRPAKRRVTQEIDHEDH